MKTVIALFFTGLTAIPALAQVTQEPRRENFIGLGVRSSAVYDGSDQTQTEALPLFNYRNDWLFARTNRGIAEGGVRFNITERSAVGVQVALEGGRKASDSDFLKVRGFEDIDAGVSIGAFAETSYTLGKVPVSWLIRVRKHTDSERGLQVDMRGSVGLYRDANFSALAFGQVTIANEKSTDSLYAISPAQAQRSNLPVFNPEAGPLYASIGVVGSYAISEQWSLIALAEQRRLRGDARKSPIVEKNSNTLATLGLIYRF